MFNWFKREINECRGWRCDPYCDGCKLEKCNEYDNAQDHIYKFKKMPASSPDYKTICKAFRATRYPFGDSWNPDILGIYNVVSANSDVCEDSSVRKESMLLYLGYQKYTGIGGFLSKGLNYCQTLNPVERITLNNTSFQATNNHYHVLQANSCTCVRHNNEVIFVMVCEVPGPKEAKVFGQSEMEGRGEHPFEKYKGEYSLDDNCFFKDSLGRGLSRGRFPAEIKCAMLKGKKLCDVYSVDKSLVKPAYLVAVRLPYDIYQTYILY